MSPKSTRNAEIADLDFTFSPFLTPRSRLVEETNDLSGDVLATGLLVVHDTSRGGEDDVAELTGGQQLDNPLLEVGETDVVAGRDNTSLVETAVKLDDDLAGAVVVNLSELGDVAWRRNISGLLREIKR